MLETLKGLSEIYNSPIQSCTVTQIKRFLLNEISYSQSVINKEFEMLRKVFAEAEKRGIINKNLMLDIEKPHSKQKKIAVRGLNLDERKKLVGHFFYRLAAVFFVPLFNEFGGFNEGFVIAFLLNKGTFVAVPFLKEGI